MLVKCAIEVVHLKCLVPSFFFIVNQLLTSMFATYSVTVQLSYNLSAMNNVIYTANCVQSDVFDMSKFRLQSSHKLSNSK